MPHEDQSGRPGEEAPLGPDRQRQPEAMKNEPAVRKDEEPNDDQRDCGRVCGVGPTRDICEPRVATDC